MRGDVLPTDASGREARFQRRGRRLRTVREPCSMLGWRAIWAGGPVHSRTPDSRHRTPHHCANRRSANYLFLYQTHPAIRTVASEMLRRYWPEVRSYVHSGSAPGIATVTPEPWVYSCRDSYAGLGYRGEYGRFHPR